MTTINTRTSRKCDIEELQISQRYLFPSYTKGNSKLVPGMLRLALQQHNHHTRTKSESLRSIRVLGHLDPDGKDIFRTELNLATIPSMCYLKNVADTIVQLKEIQCTTYEDLSKSTTPYILCCVPDYKGLPLVINEEEVVNQMGGYRKPDDALQTTRQNQHATWGAFVTTFHRDTMFSRKVHTLNPGSIKIWCMERNIGQMNLTHKNDSETEMRLVLENPQNFDFFLQKPWQVVEHKGAYAHFVITLNGKWSAYGKWSALIGWEINNAPQIHHSMRVETPLLQGRRGYLEKVTESQFLSGCAKTTRLSANMLKAERSKHNAFLIRQQKKSLDHAARVRKARDNRQVRYGGLRRGSAPLVAPDVPDLGLKSAP